MRKKTEIHIEEPKWYCGLAGSAYYNWEDLLYVDVGHKAYLLYVNGLNVYVLLRLISNKRFLEENSELQGG